MSASRRKATKRRDNDPVRVFKDGRIAYWTGGRPGAGVRKWDRCTPGDEAEERALELRVMLRAGHRGAVPRAESTLDEVMQAALDDLRATQATGRQRPSVQDQLELLGPRGRGSNALP